MDSFFLPVLFFSFFFFFFTLSAMFSAFFFRFFFFFSFSTTHASCLLCFFHSLSLFRYYFFLPCFSASLLSGPPFLPWSELSRGLQTFRLAFFFFLPSSVHAALSSPLSSYRVVVRSSLPPSSLMAPSIFSLLLPKSSQSPLTQDFLPPTSVTP